MPALGEPRARTGQPAWLGRGVHRRSRVRSGRSSAVAAAPLVEFEGAQALALVDQQAVRQDRRPASRVVGVGRTGSCSRRASAGPGASDAPSAAIRIARAVTAGGETQPPEAGAGEDRQARADHAPVDDPEPFGRAFGEIKGAEQAGVGTPVIHRHVDARTRREVGHPNPVPHGSVQCAAVIPAGLNRPASCPTERRLQATFRVAWRCSAPYQEDLALEGDGVRSRAREHKARESGPQREALQEHDEPGVCRRRRTVFASATRRRDRDWIALAGHGVRC